MFLNVFYSWLIAQVFHPILFMVSLWSKPVTVKIKIYDAIYYLCKSGWIYCLLTIPALALPFMYLISITYVLIYGWFALAVFTIIYFIIVFCNPKFIAKMSILFIGVVAAVALSFQMIEVLKAEDNVWHSGAFLLFPLAAVVSR